MKLTVTSRKRRRIFLLPYSDDASIIRRELNRSFLFNIYL